MSISLEALEAEVLKLPTGSRAHLLDRLIASLESTLTTKRHGG